jgi:hypothetical protein
MKIKPKTFETVEVFVFDQPYTIPPEGRDLPEEVIQKILDECPNRFEAGGEE